MQRETKARIDSLLYELRSWAAGEPARFTVEELSQRFDLDPFVVKRLCHSEGWPLEDFTPIPEERSGMSTTQPIQLDDPSED